MSIQKTLYSGAPALLALLFIRVTWFTIWVTSSIIYLNISWPSVPIYADTGSKYLRFCLCHPTTPISYILYNLHISRPRDLVVTKLNLQWYIKLWQILFYLLWKINNWWRLFVNYFRIKYIIIRIKYPIRSVTTIVIYFVQIFNQHMRIF